jgi:hypothetical protein
MALTWNTGVLGFMQCFLVGTGTPPFTPLPFNCRGGASILSDGGAGTSSGSFLMQPGTYQVQFYANVSGCGGVAAIILPSPFPVEGGTWLSSSSSQCGSLGIVASALIMQFGPNQVLRFLNFEAPGNIGVVTSPTGATLIITKLQ